MAKNTSTSVEKSKIVKEFATYAWADEKKSVKIYIDFPAADQIDEGDVQISSTETSIDFLVQRPDEDYKLSIPVLHASIDSATVKKKSDKFVLSLKKSVETSWFDLKKKS